jgi:hypothetical protein
VFEWNLKIEHWYVKIVERNLHFLQKNKNFSQVRDFNTQRDARRAEEGEKKRKNGKDGCMQLCARIVAEKQKYLSNLHKVGRFIAESVTRRGDS